jgi:hypothetical protein
MAIAPNMFGIDPMSYQQQQNQQDFNQSIQYAALDPFQRATAGIYQGATQFGRAAQGLLGMEDPQIAASREAQSMMGKYDISTSEGLKGLSLSLMQRAQETNSPVLAGLAQQAASQYQKVLLNEATVEQKTREKMPNIGEQVNQGLYAQALKEAKGDPILAAQIYNQRELSEKVKVSSAGVPQPGAVPLDALKTGVNIVKEFTGDSQDSLKQIQLIGATGKALKSNPTLLPQFKTQIAQFTKDKQLSAKQIEKALGNEGIASDVIEGFNNFITGKPSDIKIDDVLRGTKALEKVYADQYTQGRNRAKTVLEQAKITPETQAALLPPPYNINAKPTLTTPAVGTIRGNWEYIGGDPAKKTSWKAL